MESYSQVGRASQGTVCKKSVGNYFKASVGTSKTNQCENTIRRQLWDTVRKTSVRNWLDDIYGKLPGGLLWEAIWNREDVCETVFAGYLWDIICRASVGSSQMDKCENNVSGHHFDSGRKTSVRNWLDDICGKPV